ncbi:Outer membrane protein TolC [Enhydrobacter aerosaccus]|uniref:Outer membrane protein TolC n=1 Tax=Enhydrobacter aerosaccus TaxID=225324 RepID=A0A1T4T2W3_9HYPH|nr:TolC family protein [Enhydrobacter aerosaccus]SKA34850.1 Outer membrane protein TolC [Enhydrobacter aerosaccus]
MRPSILKSSLWCRQAVARATVAMAMLLAAGCASYTARPIEPAATAAALEKRSLDDAGLQSFLAAARPQQAAANTASWDLSSLTLAALYFHPDLEISKARLALARAGVKTAGQLPNPTFTLDPTQHGVVVDPSPWTVGFLITFVLETAGKRDKRLEQARNLVDAARQDLATAGWQVRGGVRTGLLDLWAADGRHRLAVRRQAVQEQVVALLERRFGAGEASALDVARERIALGQARLALREAERQAADARARLATAVGVPLRAVEALRPAFAAFDDPLRTPDPAALSAGEMRRTALRARTDVLGLLAQYEAAQSALKLAIAKQYPDLSVGPGYAYDQGDNLYTFAVGTEVPILNQNQGPIAEAEARRGEAAARVVALQATVIGSIDRSLAAWQSAGRGLGTAEELVRAETLRRARIERAVRLGEADRLAGLTAELEQVVVEQARFEAIVQQREALAQIEDALQVPMFDADETSLKLPAPS